MNVITDCEADTDFLGNDIRAETGAKSSQECSNMCAAEPECKSFTYVQG